MVSNDPGPSAGPGAGRRGRPRLWLAVGSTLLLAVLAAAVWVRGNPGAFAFGERAQITRGAAVYAASCASCHGARLEGQADWRAPKPDGTYPAPPHDAEGHTWHHSDALLSRYVRLGGAGALGDLPGFRSAMPGFAGTLSDQDIQDALAFIKAQWPERERAYQRAASEREE